MVAETETLIIATVFPSIVDLVVGVTGSVEGGRGVNVVREGEGWGVDGERGVWGSGDVVR